MAWIVARRQHFGEVASNLRKPEPAQPSARPGTQLNANSTPLTPATQPQRNGFFVAADPSSAWFRAMALMGALEKWEPRGSLELHSPKNHILSNKKAPRKGLFYFVFLVATARFELATSAL